MRSSFFEYNVAASGLAVARASLEVTGHNIANASNPGYSKQFSEQRATWPLTYYNGKGMVGTGAEVYGVGQIRSFYLDKKYWSETAVLGEYEMKATQLGLSEGIFNELSDTGLKATFTEFFKKIQDLSTTAGNLTYRTNVIQMGETLTKMINNNAENLKKQQSDLNSEMKSQVTIINSLGEQITSLNKTIKKFELEGSKANDLRDERARLVDQLSKYVNIEVQENEKNADYAAGKYPEADDRAKSNKDFVVFINGYEFVNDTIFSDLKLVERTTKKNPTDVAGLYDISFSKTGAVFDLNHPNLKGELKGIVDMRDGNNGDLLGGLASSTTNYKGIPHYMNKLNELVRTFAKAINEGKDKNGFPIPDTIGHIDGYPKEGPKGNLFFTYDKNQSVYTGDPSFYDKLNCENFQMSSVLIGNPNLLACAKTSNRDESDNSVIKGFSKINSYTSLFKEGKLEDFIIGLSVEIGIDGKQATNFKKNYTDVTTSIDNQRISVSGVDLNEEMANIVKYNQLYQASAKLMNIIDGIYDTCINRLGV